jgi:2-oxoglutarate dehydrogenase E1 component
VLEYKAMTRKSESMPRPLELAATYQSYCADPSSVPSVWQELFARIEEDAREWLVALLQTQRTATRVQPIVPQGEGITLARDSMGALKLIRAYRVRGPLEAKLDPLDLAPRDPQPDLAPATYGFREADMDRPIFIDGQLGLESATLREFLEVLRRDYCGTLGLEFMHVQNPTERNWIQSAWKAL